MRISDWSSDLCSSDLAPRRRSGRGARPSYGGAAMTERLILVLDEGTTSTRAILYAPDGTTHGVAQRELTQHYPRPGWVEHDADEIWRATLACAVEMVAAAGGADRIAAIGKIGRAHVCTPVTNAHLVCRLLLEKKQRASN